MSNNLPPKIVIDHVEKSFYLSNKEYKVLSETNLTVLDGEFVCIVGPTGCGKTTLLNMIAGLEQVTSGAIKVDGQTVTKPNRHCGVVFQQYALFPWLTVRKNIEFALRQRGVSRSERVEMAREYLRTVKLIDFENALPKQLSGGMKQRVALARAYAAQPSVLLMDEPFGALDAETKAQLQEELLQSWKEFKTTIVFITHDVEEAVFLSQRVIVMQANPGHIKMEIPINLKERNQIVRFSSEVAELKNKVWNELH